jgi:branched-chain amino acid transport system permease protein
MELFVQQLVNAVSLGGIYALLALGLAIVFSIMGLVNFAHGEIMTLAGYTMWVVTIVFVSPPLPLIILGALAMGLLAAVLMERIAFRPVRGASVTTMLLTSFAVSGILQVVFQNVISPRPRGIVLPPELSGVISVAGIDFGIIQLTAIVMVLVSLGLIMLFLRRTTLGISMRAAAQDFSVARLMGIRADRVIATAFAISGLLAGVAAFLWVAQRGSVDPAMGLTPVIKAFIAAVMGGLGSLPGAVLGGFILGFIEIELQAWLPPEILPFKDAVALVIVLGILLWRPQGLLGRSTDRV